MTPGGHKGSGKIRHTVISSMSWGSLYAAPPAGCGLHMKIAIIHPPTCRYVVSACPKGVTGAFPVACSTTADCTCTLGCTFAFLDRRRFCSSRTSVAIAA